MWPFSTLRRIEAQLRLVNSGQAAILSELENARSDIADLSVHIAQLRRTTMHKMDDLIAKIQAEETLIDGVVALLADTRQKVVDAASGASADVQAKIETAFAELDQNSGKLAAALGTTPGGGTAPVGDPSPDATAPIDDGTNPAA